MKRAFLCTVAMFCTSGAAFAQSEAPDEGAASASPPAALSAPTPPARKEPAGFFASLDAGYAYSRLYATPIAGPHLSLVLGSDRGAWCVSFIADVDRGTTRYGLTTTAMTMGTLFEAHLDRVRVGGGPRVGAFNVARATSTDNLLSLTIGLFVRVSIDLVTFNEDHGAVFLVANASLETVGSALYGANGGLGVRF